MENPCSRAREWLHSLRSKDINSNPASNSLDDPTISNRYEAFVLRGLQIQHLQIGRLLCTYTVSPRVTVRTKPSKTLLHKPEEGGRWPGRAVMSMVDNVCAAAIMTCNEPIKVSVDYSLSYIRPAKAHDEIEIEARVLGHKGGLSTVVVDLREKKTGEIIAQARQSMHRFSGYSTPLSKI